jgi:hypothetical protein
MVNLLYEQHQQADRQRREATATGQVTFDGEVIVNGEANHPTRPARFIRVDTEK